MRKNNSVRNIIIILTIVYTRLRDKKKKKM